MTREKVIKKLENGESLYTHLEVIKLVNKIYNNFENKICKNCKYSIDVDGNNTYECIISRKLFGYDDMIVLGDFGCNRFKSKENE